MARHAEQSQRVPAGCEVYLGSSGGVEVEGINVVDRKQVSILVGVVSLGGRRDDQCPGRRAAKISAARIVAG